MSDQCMTVNNGHTRDMLAVEREQPPTPMTLDTLEVTRQGHGSFDNFKNREMVLLMVLLYLPTYLSLYLSVCILK